MKYKLLLIVMLNLEEIEREIFELLEFHLMFYIFKFFK